MRNRWLVAGLAVAGAVFLVGLYTLGQKVVAVIPWPAKAAKHDQPAPGKAGQATTINNANFTYLVPGKDPAWTMADTGAVFDEAKGVVKYSVNLTQGKVDVTISQQVMPEQLRPRGSEKFKAFIGGAKPTRSQEVGAGTVYYLPALENGAPANGSDTVIYATDEILLFGRAGRVMRYEAWAKLLGSMRQTAPK